MLSQYSSENTPILPPTHLVIEEMYCMAVQLEGESFEEGNVISQNLLIGEVKLVNDDGVDVVI